MHIDSGTAAPQLDDGIPWYKTLTRYHWFVLFVSALGWLFDTMDQQLFNLARGPAIGELVGQQHAGQHAFYGGLATCIFMIGWATGGIVFGIMGDRWGRAKTMVLTILVYSLFTGLSSLSQGFWDFSFYRFLTGLGVGGEFAVGIALVAEVMPDKARPHALGWLQACSAIGNITAAFVGMALSPMEAAGLLGEYKPWRIMFLVGALPALLALLIRRRLKEPERWLQLRASKDPNQKLGSIRELFGNPVYRRNAIVGLILATSGVVGLWGIGFFGFDLVRSVFNQKFRGELNTPDVMAEERAFVMALLRAPDANEAFARKEKTANNSRAELAKDHVKADTLFDPTSSNVYAAYGKLLEKDDGISVFNLKKALAESNKELTSDVLQVLAYAQAPPSEQPYGVLLSNILDRHQNLTSRLTMWASIYGLLFNIGAFFGIYMFSRVTHLIGRKACFAIAFTLALAATAFTFLNLRTFNDVYWMVPIMGFFQISLFGGYAIYFPELFPTRLRSTGISFCYNVGRYIASPGPLLLGVLASQIFEGYFGLDRTDSWRWAGFSMCSFFVIGLFALPFAPETRGKPLPE